MRVLMIGGDASEGEVVQQNLSAATSICFTEAVPPLVARFRATDPPERAQRLLRGWQYIGKIAAALDGELVGCGSTS
jgi:hypothetical protein